MKRYIVTHEVYKVVILNGQTPVKDWVKEASRDFEKLTKAEEEANGYLDPNFENVRNVKIVELESTKAWSVKRLSPVALTLLEEEK